MNTVCFTGSRPKKLCGYNKESYAGFVRWLTDYLDNEFYSKGVSRYISGGAQGFDQIAFWAVYYLSKRHPEIENIVYVPFRGQEQIWAETGLFSKQQYHTMLKYATDVRVLWPVDKKASHHIVSHALIQRNHKMVNDADAVVALYKGNDYMHSSGGTAECIRYALENKVPVYKIDYDTDNNILEVNSTKLLKTSAKVN